MSVLQKLTEGVVSRDVRKEGEALLNKWEQTGLLEGLSAGQQKQGMAVLLENQAKELLREASSMAAGDVEGFAAVAFPIVRRVFGGLIANDLVSVQPMSLPSGLIFFLDFTHSDSRMGADAADGTNVPGSIYGGGVVGRALTGGVDLSRGNAQEPGGHYDMGVAYSSAHLSASIDDGGTDAALQARIGSVIDTASTKLVSSLTEAEKKEIKFDADILAASAKFVGSIKVRLNATHFGRLSQSHLSAVELTEADGTALNGGTGNPAIVRRLTRVSDAADHELEFFVVTDSAVNLTTVSTTTIAAGNSLLVKYPASDTLVSSAALGGIVGADPWALEEPSPGTGNNASGDQKNTIAEIDIKVDSIAVTAQTKKLKAKWSPELGQDLNAYHNLDAEVELTGILSEQIALEIDRELLGELVNGATAGTRYWSRAPGLFVDSTGAELGATSAAPDFTGTVSEWYETLIETINDVSAQIHRKTLRGGANFVVCGPEVANILEFTSGFRASVTADQDRGTIGAVKAGSLSKKFDVYVDPYFLRNVCLVGRKGSSFLESGFVYAPYVPLQVTPTIFGTEDFIPRKGVMTRYAKQMVRPDMYGLVVVRGLLGEAGATS